MTSIHAYVTEYEYRGDQDYKPNEHEQAMLEDAINGYLSQDASPSAMRERAARVAESYSTAEVTSFTVGPNARPELLATNFARAQCHRIAADIRALSPEAWVGMPRTDTPS